MYLQQKCIEANFKEPACFALVIKCFCQWSVYYDTHSYTKLTKLHIRFVLESNLFDVGKILSDSGAFKSNLFEYVCLISL